MPNPLRGEAVLKAGDKEFTLLYDVNTFCSLEDETGLGVNDLVKQIQGSPSFTLLRAIFAAGLQAKHPGTSATDAGVIMSDAGIEEMTKALHTAFQRAMPAAKKGGERPPQKGRTKRT